LFGKWLNGLRDPQVRARVAARLIRLENGNLGDCKPIRAGVWELKLDFGPGYRVYYALEDKTLFCFVKGAISARSTQISKWQSSDGTNGSQGVIHEKRNDT
jgi:putative addiction module killer protein